MTRAYEQHLTLDEIDALLGDAAYASAHPHLLDCAECRERIELERDVIARLAALPHAVPSADFSDRVMAQVKVPALAPAPYRRPAVASFRPLAIAASIILVAMASSIAWSLANQELLRSTLGTLGSGALDWIWLTVRGVGANVMEQPWYSAVRGFFADPARLAGISAGITLVYLGGVYALRKLMALPTQGVAHAHA